MGICTINAFYGSLRAYMMNINLPEGVSLSILYAVMRKSYSKVWRVHGMSKVKFEYLCLLSVLDELYLPYYQTNIRLVYSGKHSDLRYYREWSEAEGYVLNGALTPLSRSVFRTFDDEFRRLVADLDL